MIKLMILVLICTIGYANLLSETISSSDMGHASVWSFDSTNSNRLDAFLSKHSLLQTNDDPLFSINSNNRQRTFSETPLLEIDRGDNLILNALFHILIEPIFEPEVFSQEDRYFSNQWDMRDNERRTSRDCFRIQREVGR
jgi:hypothetical protein